MKRPISQYGFLENIQNKKNRVLSGLALLCALILGVGIYTEHYFVIFMFGVWLCAEALLLKLQPLLRWSFRKTLVSEPASDQEFLWRLFHEADENSEVISGIKLLHWLGSDPSEVQKRWALQFRLLSQLKLIMDCKKDLPGIRKIQQRFLFRKKGNCRSVEHEKQTLEIKSVQTLIEAAVLVSDLIARVQVIAQNEDNRMGEEAKALIAQILGGHFDAPRSGLLIDQLCDVMQSDSGVPFLILNLLHEGRFYEAREFATAILANEIFVEEDLRSTLYWLAEVEWFSREKKSEVLDHDNAIRYLYHLCFMSPDRAGFLEIDSQFFSEFAPVNEIAEEGFVFKETLVESFLELWKNYEGWFDGLFQNSLESITGRKSKIYDERDNWERFWLQEQNDFSREYLYVIEGNLSYAQGNFADAAHCYQKALALVPDLRSALFNLLFASAKL
ncbi:MAG: tetratricopeptide repeat protein, partial [Bdellovibrionales bacterium]|nr:tetratricopeptide repeat protein [Bdellovibrionales bacterium]